MTIDFYRWDNITTNTLLYPKLLHSTLPHSLSIILSYRNVLNFQRKFFRAWTKTDSPIRQKFALLISNTNFDDPQFARFQRLSLSIGRFFSSSSAGGVNSLPKKDRQRWRIADQSVT